MPHKNPIEVDYEVTQANARGDLVEMRSEHRERYSCVLTDRWFVYFRDKARHMIGEQPEIEREIAATKLKLKALQDRLEDVRHGAGHMAVQLLSEPPQGLFEFSGRLHVLRGTGHCILLTEEGEPILETYRGLTDKERAEFSRLEEERAKKLEADRQLDFTRDRIEIPDPEEPPADDALFETEREIETSNGREELEDEIPFGAGA